MLKPQNIDEETSLAAQDVRQALLLKLRGQTRHAWGNYGAAKVVDIEMPITAEGQEGEIKRPLLWSVIFEETEINPDTGTKSQYSSNLGLLMPDQDVQKIFEEYFGNN